MKKIISLSITIITIIFLLTPNLAIAQPQPGVPSWSTTPTTITMTAGGQKIEFKKFTQGKVNNQEFDLFNSHSTVLAAKPIENGKREVDGLFGLMGAGTGSSPWWCYSWTIETTAGVQRYCALNSSSAINHFFNPDPAAGDIIYIVANQFSGGQPVTVNIDYGTSQIPQQVLSDCKSQIPTYDSLAVGDANNNVFWEYVYGIQSKFNINVLQQAYGVKNNDEAIKKFLPEAQELYQRLIVNVSPIDYYDQIQTELVKLDQAMIDAVQNHMPAGGGTAGSNCQTLPTGVGKFFGWIGCFSYDKISGILAQADVSHALIRGLAGMYYANAYSTKYLECIKQKLTALDPVKYKSIIDNITDSQTKIASAMGEMKQSATDSGIIYAAAQATPELDWTAKAIKWIKCKLRNGFIVVFQFEANMMGWLLRRNY